jgi:hypothetical protein
MKGKNRELERFFFDSFVRNVSDFPQGIVTHEDAPDFFVSGPTSLIGIEVTNVFRASSLGDCLEQQSDAEKQLIVEKSQAIAIAWRLPSLYVSVNFSCQYRPKKANRDLIAKKLVETVKKRLASDDDDSFALEYEDGLPTEIDYVLVHRKLAIDYPFWQTTLVGFVVENCEPDFQRVIDAKNAKLPKYKQLCSECWLLIVADWFAGSSAFFEPNHKILTHDFTTGFDRVYFHDIFGGNVLRLATKNTIA